MRRIHREVIVWAVCVLAAGVAAAGGFINHGTLNPVYQTVFRLDTPEADSTVFGIVEVAGYIFDQRRGVSQVTLMIDGAAVHDADINVAREDVWWKYPGFVGEATRHPGFRTSFRAANYAVGMHTLAIRVRFSNGDESLLAERTIEVVNRYQPPVGALDRPRSASSLDPAATPDIVSGAYPISGWAIDDLGIRQRLSPAGCLGAPSVTCRVLADIEVMIDDHVVAQATYPLPRPDVANAHPDVPDAFHSGFLMNLDTTRYTNGPHTISVRAWDDDPDGPKSSVFGSRVIWIENNVATLKPFGHIDMPMPDAHLFAASCSTPPPVSGGPYQQGTHIDWVSGWVVDQNDNARFKGVKYVELLLDGALLFSTSTDCRYLPAMGQNVNCLGFDRADVLYSYPQFDADAKNSGFFFAVDVDYLLALGFHRGLHYLAIRVGTQDPDRPAVIIDQIPVILDCDENYNYPSYGELDVPVPMQDMRGVEWVKGWVIEYNYLQVLNFWVDGVLDGSLVAPNSHLNMQRPDVVARFPWLPAYFRLYNGFEYQLDTRKYVDGVHQLVIETIDQGGFRNYWVQRPVRFDNLNRP